MSYAREVGERLREVRVAMGLSLQDVERNSDGLWKAVVVGSYERGDRNITATRLVELAEFYEVNPAQVLPGEQPITRVADDATMLDLRQLEVHASRYKAVRRYIESIQVQRGDFNRHVLSIRGEDLRALAVIEDTTPAELLESFRADAIIVDTPSRG